MPLFQRRQKQREKAERLARGDSIPLSAKFDQRTRTRILYTIVDNSPSYLGEVFGRPAPAERFLPIVRDVLLREWGEVTLSQQSKPAEDLASFVGGRASDGQMLDVIEAVFGAFDRAESVMPDYERLRPHSEADEFRTRVNQILDEHDLAYQVVGSEVVPRESMAMHVGVIAPALSLLHGDQPLAKVERAFRDALRELKPGGDPADAVTDAATALQEMLMALGADGNALGPLLTSARKRELLGPHDSKLAEGAQLIGQWVSADRSARGDAHRVRETTVDDAWLAVHVVGALILRLEKRL
jgi:hypothetical protein